MKHGKKPNVRQCKFMQKNGLDSTQWLVAKDTPAEMVLVSRATGEIKTCAKVVQ